MARWSISSGNITALARLVEVCPVVDRVRRVGVGNASSASGGGCRGRFDFWAPSAAKEPSTSFAFRTRRD